MRHARILTVLALVLVLAAAGAFAASDWLKGSTEEQLKALAELQPGLGTVMIEYGARYTNAYYAAKGGNWDLAAYQLKEAREIQEVGEKTRPARAQALKAFEKSYLDPLDEAIKAKDFKKFEVAFNKGCPRLQRLSRGSGLPLHQVPASERTHIPAVNEAVTPLHPATGFGIGI